MNVRLVYSMNIFITLAAFSVLPTLQGAASDDTTRTPRQVLWKDLIKASNTHMKLQKNLEPNDNMRASSEGDEDHIEDRAISENGRFTVLGSFKKNVPGSYIRLVDGNHAGDGALYYIGHDSICEAIDHLAVSSDGTLIAAVENYSRQNVSSVCAWYRAGGNTPLIRLPLPEAVLNNAHTTSLAIHTSDEGCFLVARQNCHKYVIWSLNDFDQCPQTIELEGDGSIINP
ncbi:MAG TPA: hypothetical protein VGT41_06000 [Candidatus Babeliales bacterium]|nr:hypothetical protein [Candidatus Babeliales bacterium]